MVLSSLSSGGLSLRPMTNTPGVTTSVASCPCNAATRTPAHRSISFPRLLARNRRRINSVSYHSVSVSPPNNVQYEFCDGASDVELRLLLRGMGDLSSKDMQVDVDDNSLSVRIKQSESYVTLMETKQLYGRVKAGETIWYLDDDQLVINLRKQDEELKWPEILESWQSLSVGVFQLLKGTSIYLVGDSSEINQKVAKELATGLGYTPIDTQGLLETFGNRSIKSWVDADGSDSVAVAEEAVLESLSSHVRVVVATLGGQHGAAVRAEKWRHLYAGFTVWLSQSEVTDTITLQDHMITDEDSAKDEARKQVYDGSQGYSKADVVVKLGGWDPAHAKTVAQASLSALKQLILSDKKLPGKKSLYIRLGCRGDWPNIEPPGWDPSSGTDVNNGAM